LGRAKPVYETVKGWHSDIRGIRQFADLPREAQAYVEKVEELVGVKVGWVSKWPVRR
jgi:adenylosuccinate synthase